MSREQLWGKARGKAGDNFEITAANQRLEFYRGRNKTEEQTMRRLAGVLVGVSVLIGVTAAEAADRMVVKARKDGATRPSFYVGLHGGGGWSHTSSDTAAFATNGSGWLGGAQAGVNYQMRNFVLGLEGDYSAASIGGTMYRQAEPRSIPARDPATWLAQASNRPSPT